MSKTAELRAHVFQCYRQGLSLPEIAAELNIGLAVARKHLAAALVANAELTMDMRREMEDARLDMAQIAIWESVQAGDPKAIDLFLKLHDRRVKLWGLVTASRSTSQASKAPHPDEIVVHVERDPAQFPPGSLGERLTTADDADSE